MWNYIQISNNTIAHVYTELYEGAVACCTSDWRLADNISNGVFDTVKRRLKQSVHGVWCQPKHSLCGPSHVLASVASNSRLHCRVLQQPNTTQLRLIAATVAEISCSRRDPTCRRPFIHSFIPAPTTCECNKKAENVKSSQKLSASEQKQFWLKFW